MTNCPNCGAPLKKSKCEYCGTQLFISSETDYSIEQKIYATQEQLQKAYIDISQSYQIQYITNFFK